MLTEQHRIFIQVLIDKTDSHAITWMKGNSRFSYRATNKENNFKVDKYFAGNDNSSCLNLSTFDKNGVLLMEIVLCKVFDDQREDYDLLNSLYTKVEMLVTGSIIQQD